MIHKLEKLIKKPAKYHPIYKLSFTKISSDNYLNRMKNSLLIELLHLNTNSKETSTDYSTACRWNKLK